MRLPVGPRDALRLAMMPLDELRAWLAKCTPRDLLLLDAQFEMWAQTGQLPPQGEGWRVWLMMAGRGFGKTRAGAEWVHGLAMTGRKRIALVGASIDEARAIMVEGVSGLLATAMRHGVKLRWEPSKGELTWPGGSIAKLYSGDHADGLRGPEFHFAWCVAGAGCAGGRVCGRAPAGRSACCSGGRQQLHRRRRTDRSMGFARWRGCSVDKRWLAIPGPGRGHRIARSRQRRRCLLSRRGLGAWRDAR